MFPEFLAALAVFAFVTSISPGPSNVLLMASGANFGFRRTVPQILGITLGFASLLLAVGLGLGALLTAVPTLHLLLKAGGAAYLLYLAWRIATATPSVPGMGDAPEAGRPLTFLESAGFQWVNPKAWIVAVTTMAVYTSPTAPFLSVLLCAAAFALVNLPAVSVWAGFGVVLRGLLSRPQRVRAFNRVMGLLLVASLWPLLAA